MCGGKFQTLAQQALAPETDVEGEDVENLAGRKFRVCFHHLHAPASVLKGSCNSGMFGQGNLGVRDDAGGEQGMGGTADVTLHPADQQRDLSKCCFDGTGILSVSHKAAGAAAGALQLTYLDGIHGIIIKLL